MSQRVVAFSANKRLLPFSSFLQRVKRTRTDVKRRELIADATADELLALVEIAYNVLHAHFPLKRNELNRLKPHAPFVRKLARVRCERSARKLVQTGAGLAGVLPLITPILIHLLTSLRTD
ncbi:hypothetical protein M3Y96_01144000 [Aphelenchoides besseyi]|nr:hypothetical protein M3Y96_01144000 [Aphelenchoides besseyi]